MLLGEIWCCTWLFVLESYQMTVNFYKSIVLFAHPLQYLKFLFIFSAAITVLHVTLEPFTVRRPRPLQGQPCRGLPDEQWCEFNRMTLLRVR